ncbi:MAG: diaminopimelate epimerase [Planctomycetota bacterium]
MKFTKMHGAGNDYVYLDCFAASPPQSPDVLSRLVSDRHKGIGSDGLILICPSEEADAEMRMFNADGSESEMCGNGIRCVAKYLFDHKIVENTSISVKTGAGILTLDVFAEMGKVHSVRVDMGKPHLAAAQIPTLIQGDPENGNRVIDRSIEISGRTCEVTLVSMGNPHCVVFVDDVDVDPQCAQQMDRLVTGIGPLLENDARFPERINVEFVSVESKDVVRQRTWERGSGETMACGTGASAVCVAGVLTGRTDRKITNHLTGGTLVLEWDEESGHVFMTGPAVEVYSGELDLDAFVLNPESALS